MTKVPFKSFTWDELQVLIPARISTMSIEERFWAKVRPQGDCLVWTAAKTPQGYGRFMACPAVGVIFAHRFSYLMTNKFLPAQEIMHSCDNPSCVKPEHLAPGTHDDNMKQMKQRGRSAPTRPNHQGELHRSHKLTEEIVQYMRACVARKLKTQKQLAADFGVHQVTVSEAVTRKGWRYIPERTFTDAELKSVEQSIYGKNC